MKNGHLEVLQYALEHGCSEEVNDDDNDSEEDDNDNDSEEDDDDDDSEEDDD